MPAARGCCGCRSHDAVRAGFAAMLAYDDDKESGDGDCWAAGDVGVAEWSYIQRDAHGNIAEVVRGCDLFRFRGDLIVVKNAFRKTTS